MSAKADVPSPPASKTAIPAVAEERKERRRPEWADLDEGDDSVNSHAIEPAGRIEERPDGTVLLSNRGSAPDTPEVNGNSAPSERASAVSDYFLQMDVIRSEAGAGDPNAFAMDLIKTAMSGSTSGFDQLIADTKRMEQEARQVTPPPSCEGYHQASLDALVESEAVLEAMKSAIAGRDIGQLTSIARQAEALQDKAKAVQEMREQIMADVRR